VIRLRARIGFVFQTVDIVSKVRDAISPDNTPLPPGLSINVKIEGNTMNIIIESDRGIDSFRGTIEDLMSAIDLSLRTIDTIEK